MLKAQLESLLFLSSNPVRFEKLKTFLKVEDDELEMALKELQADYAEGHGIMLLVQEHKDKMKNEYQFVSVTENLELVQKFFRLQDGVDLTKTAIETLTIVAYRGPVKRTEIEYVRGVNSRQILNQLLSRDLVVEVEEDVFETSGRFLQLLGLKKLEDLDNYGHLHDLSLIENQPNAEKDKEEDKGESRQQAEKENDNIEENVETSEEEIVVKEDDNVEIPEEEMKEKIGEIVEVLEDVEEELEEEK